jgi:glucose/arabinose dehydrogenase
MKICQVLAIMIVGITAQASSAELIRREIIKTAYLDLELKEFSLPKSLRGNGGALATSDSSGLIVVSSDGQFLRVGMTNGVVVQSEYLPSIKSLMDAEGLKKSKRYTYQETPPRAHDLIYHGGIFYVSFDRYVSTGDYVNFNIAQFSVGDRAWSLIYSSPPLDAAHYTLGNGGKMAVRGRSLIFTVGDYSLNESQNPSLPWGKILQLEMKPPFTPKLYSLGHRNPQGLTVMADGRLLSTEHGPQGGDEINVIEAGNNYGWPWESYGTKYGSHTEYRDDLGVPPANSLFIPPLYAFVPSVALSQVIQVTKFSKRWDGNLLIGSLKAKSLFHVRLMGDRVQFAEPIYIGSRIRDLKQFDDSSIYLLTDTPTLIELKKSPSN